MRFAALALLLASPCSSAPGAGLARAPAVAAIAAGLSLPAGCQAGTATLGSQVEPSLAGDPKDSRRLVVAWQQDRLRGGAASAIAVAASGDGGRTWSAQILPNLTTCSGGGYTSASDPWLSIGPDGAVYASVLTVHSGQPTLTGIAVSTSHDHGRTWSDPVPIGSPVPTVLVDKEVVLADPWRPGAAYVAWAAYRLSGRNIAPGNVLSMASTSDGGRTWSEPRTIYGADSESQSVELVSPAAGVLVAVFAEARDFAQPPIKQATPATVRSTRSVDAGVTWSPAQTVARYTDTSPVDPASGGPLRVSGELIAAAASSGGRVYAGWFEDHLGDRSSTWISRSDDRGLSWSDPMLVAGGPNQLLAPVLAVAGDGAVGVLWHSVSGGTALSSLDVDAWLAVSKDRGASWRQEHLAGPADLRAATITDGGPFLGDYQGLAGLPDRFATAFAMSRPVAPKGISAIEFTTVRF